MTEKMINDIGYEYQEIFSKNYLGVGYEDIDDFALKNDLVFTDDPTRAIYLFPNGEMIDGWSKEARLYGGPRDSDHGNSIQGLIPNLKRYEDTDKFDCDKFWITCFEKLNFVLLVPEEGVAIYAYNQNLTDAQECVLEELNYQVDCSECHARMTVENKINEKYHVEIYGNKEDSLAIKEVLKNAYDVHSYEAMSITPYTDLHMDTLFTNVIEKPLDDKSNICKYEVDIDCESRLDLVDAIRYIGLNCPELEKIVAYDTKGKKEIDTDQFKGEIVADKKKKEQAQRELEKIARKKAAKEKEKAAQLPKEPNLFNVLDNIRKMPLLIENDVLKDISGVYGVDGDMPLFSMVKKIRKIGLEPMLKVLNEKVSPIVLSSEDENAKKQFKDAVEQIKIIKPKFEINKEGQKSNVNIDFKALKQTKKAMSKSIQKEHQIENDER